MQIDLTITGTHIWYYFICKREVWLISHQITPDQDDENIILGRYYDAEAYQRERKSLVIENSRIDVYHKENGQLVVGEVKKSSKYQESARMQLAFYLKRLKENGVHAKGELRFPTEKKKEVIQLTNELEETLKKIEEEITELIRLKQTPPPQRIGFCKNCGYVEYCWS